jgi:hypothetical protein
VYVAENPHNLRFAGVTVFDLSEKTYGKLGSDFEASVISFMNSYRARFVPAERRRIEDAPGTPRPDTAGVAVSPPSSIRLLGRLQGLCFPAMSDKLGRCLGQVLHLR